MTFKEFQKLRTGVACLEEIASLPEYKGVGGYTYDGLYISLNSGNDGRYTLFIFRDQWNDDDLEKLERILWTFYLSEGDGDVHEPLNREDINHYVTACFDAADGATFDHHAKCKRFDPSLIPDGYNAAQIDSIIYDGHGLPDLSTS